MQLQFSGSGGSSTDVMEMQTTIPPAPSKPSILTSSASPARSDHSKVDFDDSTSPSGLPTPTTHTSHPILQQWNHPRINLIRLLATFYSFIILGANDAAYGALIPYLEGYYGINYTVISLVFLAPMGGYTASALLNNTIHMRFGQRGVAIMMSLSHLIAYIVVSQHVAYPAVVVVFVLAGFGNGLGDSAWNAWIGDMANANEVLGFLHGFYGLGAAMSPLIATTLITKAGWKWYEFYYLMVGAATLEVIILVTAFWHADAAQFQAEHPADAPATASSSPRESLVIQDGEVTHTMPDKKSSSSILRRLKYATSPSPKPTTYSSGPRPKHHSRTMEAIKHKVTILSAIFLLLYVGIEVSIGGWIVTFMLRVRHSTPFASGLTSTGFWLGITLGRLILGFVTGRLFKSEKHAVAVYMLISIALQLLFWLIPKFLVSAVMVGLLGFFLGPLFPAAIVCMTKLLPKRLHVASVGFAAALGASGACVLPFATGAIAQAKGVQTLQPIVLALLVACLGVWLLIPKLPKIRTA